MYSGIHYDDDVNQVLVQLIANAYAMRNPKNYVKPMSAGKTVNGMRECFMQFLGVLELRDRERFNEVCNKKDVTAYLCTWLDFALNYSCLNLFYLTSPTTP